MAEKFVKVEVLIDTTKEEQIKALNNLMVTIGIGANSEAEPAKPAATESKPKNGTKKTDAKPADPKPSHEAPETQEASQAGDESKPADVKPETAEAPVKEYKIEEVREKLKEKVSEHRSEIKAKLEELGAPNVSSLDPAKYSEFVDFLNSLS